MNVTTGEPSLAVTTPTFEPVLMSVTTSVLVVGVNVEVLTDIVPSVTGPADSVETAVEITVTAPVLAAGGCEPAALDTPPRALDAPAALLDAPAGAEELAGAALDAAPTGEEAGGVAALDGG